MPFSLTNSPATFHTLMNKLLALFLDHLVVVYLDDIFIYSKTLEEHTGYLWELFQTLRDNKLYVKKDKCSLTQEETHFLCHIAVNGKLRMDLANSKPSLNVSHQLKSPSWDLSLAWWTTADNLSRAILLLPPPLIDLLKKGRWWLSSQECQHALKALRKAIIKELVLALIDLNKPFKLYMYASNVAISGVLM